MSDGVRSNPLVEVSEHVRTHARTSKVTVIFDLDSTLFSVSPRTQHILRQLASEPDFATQFAREAEILRSVKVLPTDWGVRAVLEREKVMNSSIEFFKAVRDYWGKHFFSSGFLDRDDMYPSANEYVNHLHALGAEISYLTGRPEAQMREGTVKALNIWGFPLFPDTKLMMKPSDVLTDEGFKANVLEGMVDQYDHIWFFENEPVIIDQVRSRVPKVRIVFVDSVHAGRASSPTDLPTIGMSYEKGWK